MKTTSKINLLGIAVFILLTTSCSVDKKDEPTPDPVTITTNPASLSLPATGGEQTFTVTTTAAEWSVSVDASWLTASKQGNSVKVTASANPGSVRNITVHCTAGTATATVSVSQGQITARQYDSISLVDIYTATAGASWTRKWTLSIPMNQWYGVELSPDGRITKLDLPENNLSGVLPEAITNLTSLKYCDLHSNALTGAIYTSISQMTQLEFLDLSENSFSGAVPALSALTKLLVLDLSFNDFTALPALNSLTLLEYLAFCNNQLSGNLPDNLSALVQLGYLDASNNSFSGNIPSTWSSLTRIQILYLYSNSLGGNIPAWLTNFTALAKLALDGNNLDGNIPSGLGSLPNLAELYLSQNRLTGSIPASLLVNVNWANWQVCSQQDGFGFDNYDCISGTSVPQSMSVEKQDRTRFKNIYRH